MKGNLTQIVSAICEIHEKKKSSNYQQKEGLKNKGKASSALKLSCTTECSIVCKLFDSSRIGVYLFHR